MKTKFLFYVVMIAVLLAGCASPQAATTVAPPTVAPSATPLPTATASPIPPSPTPTPPPTTIIVIDGKADDWANYSVNVTDLTGDQKPGMADLIEARYFKNDQYLYIMVRLEGMEGWDGIAIVGFVGGKGGQLSTRPNKHTDFRYFGEGNSDLAVTMEIGEVVELKIALDQFPSKSIEFHILSLYNGPKYGNDPVDDSQNGQVQPIKSVKEFEPTPLPGFASKPLPTRVEFAAEDGQALVGYYYPSWKLNAPVVLLVHQYGLPQENWVNYGMVDWLQNWSPLGQARGLFPPMPVDQSFAVFTLDLRGFGESGPPIPKNVSDEEYNKYAAGWIQDVKAALDYVKTLPNVDASRIAIIGANNGADASVVSCGDCLGVLALSAGNYVDEDFKATVEALDAQGKVVWCFSTEKSAGADVETCGSVTGNQYKWINFPGDGRGMQLIREDKAPEGIGQSILEFLAAVIPASNSASAVIPSLQSTIAPTKTSQPAVAACLGGEKELFASDFESGTTGWDLDPASAWSVISDGSKVLQGTGHVHANHPESWENFIWRLKVKIEGGRAHLNFHWKDDQRYLISFAADWTQAMKIPGSEMLQQVDVAHTQGQWHVVEISLLNGKLKVATDGIQEIDYADTAPLGPGGIWLEVLEDSVVKFDDIYVCQP
ncbi:MAG: hypothetical protein MHPDNHAH_02069 [Anaerolineales bacterium]|nr:hypothetical protein [Anaerolineales bacterium]